jgi:TusA-related sulfurtransferase
MSLIAGRPDSVDQQMKAVWTSEHRVSLSWTREELEVMESVEWTVVRSIFSDHLARPDVRRRIAEARNLKEAKDAALVPLWFDCPPATFHTIRAICERLEKYSSTDEIQKSQPTLSSIRPEGQVVA